MTEALDIQKITKQDLPRLWDIITALQYEKDPAYFDRCLERQDKGEIDLYIARDEQEPCGYCILSWDPKYTLYQRMNIPEIQDLNIVTAKRRRGYGRTLITFCEDTVREKGYKHIGIGVGVHASYGPAQRLYFDLGYKPDGHGVNYDRQVVDFGALKPVDDQLCIMMIKPLKP